jgi:hypothetical protein
LFSVKQKYTGILQEILFVYKITDADAAIKIDYLRSVPGKKRYVMDLDTMRILSDRS